MNTLTFNKIEKNVEQYFADVSNFKRTIDYLGIISAILLINYHYYFGVLYKFILSKHMYSIMNKLTYKIFFLDTINLFLYFIFVRYLSSEVFKLDSMLKFTLFSSLLYIIIVCFYYFLAVNLISSKDDIMKHPILETSKKLLEEKGLFYVLGMNIIYWLFIVLTTSNYIAMNINLQLISLFVTLPFIVLLFI